MSYADHLEIAGLWQVASFSRVTFLTGSFIARNCSSDISKVPSEFTGFGDGEFAVAVFDLEVGRARDTKH